MYKIHFQTKRIQHFHLCICMWCVWAHLFVWMWACMPQYMCGGWRTVSVLGSLPATSSEAGPLALYCCVCKTSWPKTSWPAGFQGPSCQCIPSPHRSTGITDACTCLQLCVGSGGSGSGPHGCTASPSLADSCLWSSSPDSLSYLSVWPPPHLLCPPVPRILSTFVSCVLFHTPHFLKNLFPFMIPLLVLWPITWICI